MLRIWGYRSLLTEYIRTSYRLRYRQSFIGLWWAVLPTLGALAVGTLVFHRVARVSSGDVPYPVFTLAALAPWALVPSTLSFGAPSVAAAGSIISRVPFPRAILPLSALGSSLIDLAVSMAIFTVFSLVYGIGIPWTALLFPPILVIEIALLAGLVLLASAINVFARDVRVMIPLGVQLWLFVTPIMYPLSAVPDHLRSLYLFNPMTGLAESYRSILLHGRLPEPAIIVPPIVIAAALLLIGSWYFAATEKRFADVV